MSGKPNPGSEEAVANLYLALNKHDNKYENLQRVH